MEQYIPKSALVAEIKRRIDEINQLGKKASYEVGLVDAYKIILSCLDTLEVKEVDLEKGFNDFLDNVEGMPRMRHSDEQIEWGKDIARHFYGLGLKARKEEVK